ncbi:hypothetical protein T4C_6667 [Trichinella pseudospiralis]|uniref:Uncharacterized protein n=1 Tax=Trichinella pseudospiralis TaxID=6337 RepID=A0A0V1GED7_TRIPS|nr:hypothetical protein T4C_6667 [Trichinella pseudospiralis]
MSIGTANTLQLIWCSAPIVNAFGSKQQQRSNSGRKPREYLQHCNP